jgi:hypothetical protein
LGFLFLGCVAWVPWIRRGRLLAGVGEGDLDKPISGVLVPLDDLHPDRVGPADGRRLFGLGAEAQMAPSP